MFNQFCFSELLSWQEINFFENSLLVKVLALSKVSKVYLLLCPFYYYYYYYIAALEELLIYFISFIFFPTGKKVLCVWSAWWRMEWMEWIQRRQLMVKYMYVINICKDIWKNRAWKSATTSSSKLASSPGSTLTNCCRIFNAEVRHIYIYLYIFTQYLQILKYERF